ncbi:MAG: ribose 5-phosphate isomerase B [Candidatus Krumholzibacteria bacterium]|nr:ribose 5-phosphate isomerase B [Candidatus Krumholzibacteria bacterium]
MKIALGSDHNGVEFKQLLVEHLETAGYEVVDAGPQGEESVDYPDFAFSTAEMVSNHEADRGILICGSGIGMSMAANKVNGIRAALCFTPESAALTRQHNDANVLALAGWQSEASDVLEIVDKFLTTEFEGGRHARRVDKITSYEKRRDEK